MRPLAVIAAFLLSFSALAQPSFDRNAIDKVMKATMRAWQIPGAAVAIVKNDRVIYVNGYGTKEVGGTEAVTGDTLFQIASTSKAFTTAALAMLASEQKLSFDDPVRQHLDYFRLSDMCADSQVTIRDLVSHRTGLTRHDELWDNTPLTRAEVIRSMGQVALTKPFRTTYQYQNIMFIAAGEVVANASGMSWDDYVRTRIFQPLQMTRTVITDAEWNESDHATGYRWDSRNNRVVLQRPIDTATLGAGGAIKSSARDMANWIRFQLANGAFNLTQLLDPAMLEETKMPVTPRRVEKTTRDENPETNVMSYGMGWTIQDYRGELLVSHSGALNGFRTHVDLLPRRNTGFVVMANVGRGLALVALRNTLADHLSGKPGRDWNAYYLMLDGKAHEKELRDKAERDAKRIANTTPTHALERYAGTYTSVPYGTATVTVADGKLVLQWNRLSIPLTHFHYDVFRAESEEDDVDEEVVFVLNDAREITGLRVFGERFVKKAA
jgi:CubicO group peptidase (beta-lactamase class C family)